MRNKDVTIEILRLRTEREKGKEWDRRNKGTRKKIADLEEKGKRRKMIKEEKKCTNAMDLAR